MKEFLEGKVGIMRRSSRMLQAVAMRDRRRHYSSFLLRLATSTETHPHRLTFSFT